MKISFIVLVPGFQMCPRQNGTNANMSLSHNELGW